MKRMWIVWLLPALSLTACGDGYGTKASGAADPKIEEFDTVSFPMTFTAQVEYRDDLGTVLERNIYSPITPGSLFGCLAGNGGRDLTFVMKNEGKEELRVRMPNIQLRQSKSTYEDLTEVRLDGHSADGRFRFNSSNRSDFQLERCKLVLQGAGQNLAGELTCLNVTSTTDKSQADLSVQFTCDVVQ